MKVIKQLWWEKGNSMPMPMPMAMPMAKRKPILQEKLTETTKTEVGRNDVLTLNY